MKTKTKKTKAKRMGLKSTLVSNDKVVLTSFLNGRKDNIANIEKITDFKGNDLRNAISYEPRMFNTSITPTEIKISKGEEFAKFDNPVRGIGKDYIGIKNKLEQSFFINPKANSNIYVQIAYNILDIKKILSIYINNIIYIFYNLNRDENYTIEKHNDLIGTLCSFVTYDENIKLEQREQAEKLLNNSSAYFTYFDNVFKIIEYPKQRRENTKKNIKGESIQEYKARIAMWEKVELPRLRKQNFNENYNVLRLLSSIRQLCFHSVNRNEQGKALNDRGLFNIALTLKDQPELLNILNRIASENIESINNDFVHNSGNNLYVLQQIYKNIRPEIIKKEYYKYVVEKETKNIGINLTKLRESILKNHYKYLEDHKYDTYRNKIYTVLNFILFRELKDLRIIEEMQTKLRNAEKGEEIMQSIYDEFAEKTYKVICNKFNQSIKEFDIEKINKFKDKMFICRNDINDICIGVDRIDSFSKMVLFITKFLDGKETNELLCALINKMDSIADLLDTAKKIGDEVEFSNDYTVLVNVRKMANNIRLIKNIAHLRPAKDNVTRTLLIDAYNMLNVKGQIENNSSEYNELIKELYEQPEKINFKGQKVKDHKLRNFIENNVIKSKWFFYIAKYTRPSQCPLLMSNRNLVEFALRELPSTQIKRYYNTITGHKPTDNINELKDVIINTLCQFSAENILTGVKGMNDNDFRSQEIGSKKEKLKAIVNLYLTVAYLITKSMIKVNSRFSIAFGSLERDYYLKTGEDIENKNRDKFDELTKFFLDNDAEYINKMHNEHEKLIKNLPSQLSEGKNVFTEEERKYIKKYRQFKREQEKNMHFTYHSYRYIIKDYNIGKMFYKKKSDLAVNGFNILYRNYRNTIEHLNVIASIPKYIGYVNEISSYYGLYCLILQLNLCEELKNESVNLSKYENDIVKLKTYSKDLQKIINVPFAYNLARYKNLTIEELFYDINNK